MHVRIPCGTNRSQFDSVALKSIPFCVKNLAHLCSVREFARLLLAQPAIVKARDIWIDVELRRELLHAETQRIDGLAFNHGRVHAVLAVQELDDVADAVTHSAVVLDNHVLHSLDKTTLDVTSFRRLNCSIDQTFSATHGVEKELLRSQTTQIRVLDETTRLGTEIILAKVRQCSAFETVRNTFSFYVLLSYTRNHLRNVQERTLRTGRHHHLDIVGIHKRVLRRVTSVITRLVQDLVHLLFERLLHRHTRLQLEFIVLCEFDDFLHVSFSLGDGVVNGEHCLVVRNGIRNADGETVVEHPVVDERLRLRDEPACGDGTPLFPGHVDQTATAATHSLLAQRPGEQFALFNSDTGVVHAESHVVGVLGPRTRAKQVHLR